MWWVDGRRTDRLPATDRGLHYGDGLFETMAVVDGQIRHLRLHLARLREGLRRLRIPAGVARGLDTQLLAHARGQPRAVLKLIVTRGDGQRGYAPPVDAQPRTLLQRTDWPDWPRSHASRGVAVRVCGTRLGTRPGLGGIKHLNRLEQVLARGEWRSRRWQEGLMLDCSARVVCGTMSNVFAVREGVVLTPDVSDRGVAGVMRAVIRREAPRAGLPVEVVDSITLDEIAAADECFVSNALVGVWPVRRIGALQLAAPGPVTRRLQAWLTEGGHIG